MLLNSFRRWITGQNNPELFMPEAYGPGRKPLHDDWLPGFRWVPRSWTFFPFPMPAKKFLGNMPGRFIPYQAMYPKTPDSAFHEGYITPEGTFVYAAEGGTPHLVGFDPVPPIGQWVLLGPYLPPLGMAIPLYLAASWQIGSYRVHFNIGCKPDVTLGDNGWWFPEASFSIIKLVTV